MLFILAMKESKQWYSLAEKEMVDVDKIERPLPVNQSVCIFNRKACARFLCELYYCIYLKKNRTEIDNFFSRKSSAQSNQDMRCSVVVLRLI